MIDRIHRGAVRIDPFRLGPLYGFAAFLSRAAFLLIGIAIGGFSLVILSLAHTFTLATSDYIVFGATLVVAVVAFASSCIAWRADYPFEIDAGAGLVPAPVLAAWSRGDANGSHFVDQP